MLEDQEFYDAFGLSACEPQKRIDGGLFSSSLMCDALHLDVMQSSYGSDLVYNKRAVARVYIRWPVLTDVLEQHQTEWSFCLF